MDNDLSSLVVAVLSMLLSIAGVIALPIGRRARRDLREHMLRNSEELRRLHQRIDDKQDKTQDKD